MIAEATSATTSSAARVRSGQVEVERVDADMAARHQDMGQRPGGADGEQICRQLVRARVDHRQELARRRPRPRPGRRRAAAARRRGRRRVARPSPSCSRAIHRRRGPRHRPDAGASVPPGPTWPWPRGRTSCRSCRSIWAHSAPQRLAQAGRTTSFSTLSRAVRSASRRLHELELAGRALPCTCPSRWCRRRLPRSRPRRPSTTCRTA